MNNESFNKYIEHSQNTSLIRKCRNKKRRQNSYLRQKLSSLGGSLFCGNHLRSRTRPHLT